MTVGHFLGGIAALIWYPPENTYLLLRRTQDRDSGAGEWECVTGRVDQGESFEAALHREVNEELQTSVTIEFLIGTTHFYRGDPRPDNELLGVKYLCSINASAVDAISISPEHSEYQWLTLEAIDRLLPASHWLRQTVHTAATMQALMTPELREWHQSLYRTTP